MEHEAGEREEGRRVLLRRKAPQTIVLFEEKDKMNNSLFALGTLHNMHSFDGTDVLVEDVEWAGEDVFHDDICLPSAADSTYVGLRHKYINDDKDVVDPSYDEVKFQLIDSFTNRSMVRLEKMLAQVITRTPLGPLVRSRSLPYGLLDPGTR